MNKLTTSLILLIALLSSSCKTEREVTIKGPVSSSKVVEATGQESESFQVVDILTPQKFDEELAPKELVEKDIFDLWEIFFENFVIVTSQNPYKSRVDYESLHTLLIQENPEFLTLLGLIERKMATTNLSHLSFEHRAAFYINAYNYTAIRLVNKGYLQNDGSKIKSFLDLSKGPNPLEIVYRDVLPLAQGIVSLETLENSIIHGLFSNITGDQELDARFHLALSNTSISRASLLNEAYHPETLEAQLTKVVSHALKDEERIAKKDGDTLYVTRLFKWYREDFEKDQGSIADFIKAHSSELKNFKKVKYLNYSYDINRLDQSDQEVAHLPDLPEISDPDSSGPKEDSADNDQGPCSQIKGPQVDVIYFCQNVQDGVLDGFYRYKNEVKSAEICVYRREDTENSEENKLGLRGHVIEFNIEQNRQRKTDIIVEDKYSFKNGEYELRTAGGVRTKAIMDIESQTLEVRQTSIIAGKGYRKFNLSCEAIP